MDTTRVLIIDPIPMIADSLATSLEQAPAFTTATCSHYDDCLESVTTFHPAITIIMVYQDTLESALKVCREVAAAGEESMIVVIAPRRLVDGEGLALTAIEHGADGVLVREDFNMEQVVAALRALQAGQSLVDVGQLRDALAARSTAAEREFSPDVLTPREREVATLLVDGLSTGEIALKLCISERTAQSHISNILTKLNVRSRVEAAVRLYEWRRLSTAPSDL